MFPRSITHEQTEVNEGNPIANAIEAFVSAGSLAGAATLVWREGVQRKSRALAGGMLKPSCHRTRHHLPHRIDVQADLNDKSMLIFLTHNMVELDQMADG